MTAPAGWEATGLPKNRYFLRHALLLMATAMLAGGTAAANTPMGLHRKATQHAILAASTALLMATATAITAAQGNWTCTAISVAGLAGTTLTLNMLLRNAARRNRLEEWIRKLGSGDYEYTLAPWGEDELANMRDALETLRLGALEASETHTIRELSDQLQEQNETLAATLNELRRTQDRIISQKKLAELGEISAAVAHELRNPLQFVKNFAEGSSGISQEMGRIVRNGDSRANRELMEELAGDLSENMTRISTHCDRANRIVTAMAATHVQGERVYWHVPVNQLVSEQAKIGYQAATGQHPEFSADLEFLLDPNAGEIRAVPQELGRVIINMMVNGCQATLDKTERIPGFKPKITVETKRTGKNVEIVVTDNGTGMSKEVMEKMFNPFFTTKSTGEGVGLGMSLSFDIAREHGGTITPCSLEGEYTAMTLELPAG